jgi:hypothetical protein
MILCVCTYVEATATGWKPNCSQINNNKTLGQKAFCDFTKAN